MKSEAVIQKMSSIKYNVNRRPKTYDNKTKTFHVGQHAYSNNQEAKADQWRCEKCSIDFRNFKNLRSHKNEDHSY